MTAFQWTDVNGVVWDLGGGPVSLRSGVMGLGLPRTDAFVRESAALSGQRFVGSRTSARRVFWPLTIRGATAGEWLATSRAFFAGLSTDRAGTFRVTAVDGGVRSVRLRLADPDEQPFDMDPDLFGREVVGVDLVADDPFWRGPEVVRAFQTAQDAVEFFEPPVGERTNLLPNPSFESGTAEWISFPSPTGEVSSAATFDGGMSYLATATAALPISVAGSFLPVSAGLDYTASFYVRDVNTSEGYRCAIEWFSASNFISDSISTTVTPTSTGWTRASVSAVAPAGATLARFYMVSVGPPLVGTQVRFDAAMLEQSATLNPFIQGSQNSATHALNIMNASTTATASITNPGEVDAWPVWTVVGPATQFTLGTGVTVISGTFPILVGQVLQISTDPTVQLARLFTGPTSVVVPFNAFTSIEFARIPVGVNVPLNVVVQGVGSASIRFEPAYRRAF